MDMIRLRTVAEHHERKRDPDGDQRVSSAVAAADDDRRRALDSIRHKHYLLTQGGEDTPRRHGGHGEKSWVSVFFVSPWFVNRLWSTGDSDDVDAESARPF